MKFSPCSSSLSDNYYTTKGNVFGCFGGVLSRILCSKTLQTHPSDPIESETDPHCSKIESTTPNLVARLMGLDSIPETGRKSVDSEDYRAEIEEIQGIEHRRIKTSVSFRETPEFFELEDDDFLVIRFENPQNGVKIKKKGSNYGNFDRKRRKKQKRNRVIFSNEERLSLRISPQNYGKFDHVFEGSKQSYHLSPLRDEICGKKEGFDGKKSKKKVNFLGESKDEVEFDSENLSPVSVLDHSNEFISDLEVTTSEEDARLEGSETVSTDYASQSSQINSRQKDGNKQKNVRLQRRDYRKHENVEMLRKICKLAEVEVKNSNWKYLRISTSDELENTAKDFSQGIFDQLVSELLDQLVGFEYNPI